MKLIRQSTSSRIGTVRLIKTHWYKIERPVWWKIAIKDNYEWKSALQPWKYWYYEIKPIEKIREAPKVVRQESASK